MKSIYSLFILCTIAQSLSAQLKIGDKAPEIYITEWIRNVPGDKTLMGKFLVIDFWATWCAPCLAIMPHLNELVNANKGNANLLFLSHCDEKSEKVIKTLSKVPFSSAVVSDSTGKTMPGFGIDKIPYAFLIDDSMHIKWMGSPEFLTAEVISDFINRKEITRIAPFQDESKVAMDYKELGSKYHDIRKDSTKINYFNLAPLSNVPYAKAFELKGRSLTKCYEIIVGKELSSNLASLLDCSETQIILPENMRKAYVSYCYKRAGFKDQQEAKDILLQNLTSGLNLSFSAKNSTQEVITLKVIDSVKLNQERSKGTVSHLSSSGGNTIISMDNHPLSDLKPFLQNMFNCPVIIEGEGETIYDYKLILLAKDFQQLQQSMLEYGIKVDRSSRLLKKYTFTKLGFDRTINK